MKKISTLISICLLSFILITTLIPQFNGNYNFGVNALPQDTKAPIVSSEQTSPATTSTPNAPAAPSDPAIPSDPATPNVSTTPNTPVETTTTDPNNPDPQSPPPPAKTSLPPPQQDQQPPVTQTTKSPPSPSNEPPITITLTSTVDPSKLPSPTTNPNPNPNPNSDPSSNPSSTPKSTPSNTNIGASSDNGDGSSTTKTVIISISVLGGVIIIAGAIIGVWKYRSSNSDSVDDDEVVLRDSQGGIIGDPFKNTLDKYHKSIV